MYICIYYCNCTKCAKNATKKLKVGPKLLLDICICCQEQFSITRRGWQNVNKRLWLWFIIPL